MNRRNRTTLSLVKEKDGVDLSNNSEYVK